MPAGRDWRKVKGLRTKEERRAYYDFIAADRDSWRARHAYYHAELERFHRLAIPEGASVLQIGCGTGDLLAALRPSRGVGVDFSPEMIRIAREKHPELTFVEGDAESLPVDEAFDFIIMSNVVGDLYDIWQAFRELERVMRPDSRLVVTYYNFLWEPVLKAGERLGRKMPQFYQNWLSVDDISNLLELNGLEVVRAGYRLLLPIGVPGLAAICNRFLAKLPFLRRLCLVNYLIAKPTAARAPVQPDALTCSVIIPTRNEAGNIQGAVERTPMMGAHTELIFVDGDSTDGTVERIEEAIEQYHGDKDIKLIHQVPRGSDEAHTGKMLSLGKGDAVRKGFDAAQGDVLMILDSDLTVPPEDLPRFFLAMAEGRGEFINGTRLVYQMEKQAMRFFNILGNKAFSVAFTWLLEQRIKDTLCGTKVLLKRDYEKIKANRAYFGDFDPFGDFDLLFGAAKLNLKIVEMPIHYQARTYGEIKIQRWKHGLLLLRMCAIAFRKLKLS
ncbi:MAG: glycosyltransferase [Candidatus Hydrogenedentes bacterium]|nr:glycosyltransferase [Candidatus Hydrogenedentota bacterium]